MLDEFDKFVKDAAGSPYIVFLGFVLTCLPILYFILPRIYSVFIFLLKSANSSFKKQIQNNKIKEVMALRKFKSQEQFDRFMINTHQNMVVAAGALPIYYLATVFLLIGSSGLSGDLLKDLESEVAKIAFMSAIMGFGISAIAVSRIAKNEALRRAFRAFAERRGFSESLPD